MTNIAAPILQPSLPPSVLPRWRSGVATLDAALSGGLTYGRVHEVFAAEADDAASMAGFALAVAMGMAGTRPLLWLRLRNAVKLRGVIQAQGWSDLGGQPGEALCGVMPDSVTLLRATVDALRCPALGAVIMESCGTMRALDLTVSRRLSLAAERSGVPLLLVRGEETPSPSAAQTRWLVSAAPSQPLPGQAPGAPAFDLELLRQKSGPSGLRWRLEWNRDERCFRETTPAGALVSVPARRPLAESGAGRIEQDTRYAA